MRAIRAREIYQEFVFRFNCRRHYRSSFDRLLGLGIEPQPRLLYEDIIANTFLYIVKKATAAPAINRKQAACLLRALVLDAGMSTKKARKIAAIEPRGNAVNAGDVGMRGQGW